MNIFTNLNHGYIFSFSGGQDSINLFILWKQKNFKNKIFWCHHLWKKNDFYLFRHSFQMSFFFKQRFFYTLFFSKNFTEQKARKFRYFSVLRVAQYSHSKYILTGHTQFDNIETFFLNLFRGSGKFGLQGLRQFQNLVTNEFSQKFN